MHPSEAPVAIIWDGFRHLVALWPEGGNAPMRFLAAETPGGEVALIAAADAGDDGRNTLIGVLPAGCRAVHLVTVTAAGGLDTTPVQLDERLTLDRAEAAQDGLALLHLHALPGEGAGLPGFKAERVSAGFAPSDTVVALGLNRVNPGSDGSYRILAGPFLHPDDDRSGRIRVTGAIGPGGDGLVLDFGGEDASVSDLASGVLVAHLAVAMRQARADLAALDPELRLAVEAEIDGLTVAPELDALDASGVSQVAAFRRGFRLLRAKSGETRIAIPDWREGDEVLLLAQPRLNLLWSDDGESISGAPIMVRAEAGRLHAMSLREAYAPSASTGLTTGARSSGALVAGGASRLAAPLDDAALAASRLATRLLETAVPASEATRLTEMVAGWSGAIAAEPRGGKLAGLDASLRRQARAGGLLAGLVETSGIDPSRIEELVERNLAEQIATLLWALSAPRLAARACKARLLLPLPAEGRAAELESLLAWYDDPALPQLLSRGAMALAGQDRKAARLLHEMAACVHQGWVDAGEAAETGLALEAVRGRMVARPVSKLEALLADLRREARQTPQAPALDVLGRMRSELQSEAREAGAPEKLVEELGARLADLSPVEILLLHAHFAGLRRDAARAAAAIVLLERWEAQAGCVGLAMRASRSGDALAGAARFAASTAGLAATLLRIETLAPALARLDAEIEALSGAEDRASPQAVLLRAALAGYGRLVLLHRAMGEADDVFASVPFAQAALADHADAGFGAAYRRLRAGTGETLGRYLAAAGLVSGRDHDWGTADAVARPASSA
ncbi:hypothetical protein [Bosea sp. PAMC 26642]|uniref:hypothetical protein n=1 Tax=Bosea sp. (strain PAMC 26642) TaxID=1792307 RepID=UPI000AA76933|nr:hypothetical protein [Bosea sp. PAMC 26642]